jgi:hypothetical protein
MPIEFRKYQFNGVPNYFAHDDNSRPSFYDKIVLSSVKMEDSPIFSEEFENSLDAFNVTFGDFDLGFSQLQTETSDLGKNLRQFLTENIDNHCIVCKVTWGKVFGGMVDLSATWFNDTYKDGLYDVKVQVYSFARELKDLGDSAVREPAIMYGRFTDYMNECHFATQRPLQLKVDTSNLNWAGGIEPYLVTELLSWFHNEVGNRVKKLGQLSEYTRWMMFDDLCKFWGMIYKMEITAERADQLWEVTMYLAFRDTGFGDSVSHTLSVIENQHGLDINKATNKWVYFKYIQCSNVFYTQPGYFTANDISYNNPNLGLGIFKSIDDEYRIYGGIYGTPPYFLAGLISKGSIDPYNQLIEATAGFYKLRDAYVPNQEVDIPIKDVVEIEANYYLNPSTQEGNNNTHWSYGYPSDAYSFTYPRWSFMPKNFSFPAMWTWHNYHTPFHATQAGTLSGDRHQYFYTIYYDNFSPYSGLSAIWQRVITNWLFVVTGAIKKVMQLKLSLLTGLIYKLFDTTIKNGATYVLYKLTNLDIRNREVDSYWKER